MKTHQNAAKICVVFVFLAILAVGLCVFDDYGQSTDEPAERTSDILSYRTANRILLGRDVFSDFGLVSSLHDYNDRYYGVAMRFPLVVAEDVYQSVTGTEMPLYTVYQIRHLYTFLVYYFALICFYLLLKRLFGSAWLGLTGVLMVFLFGRFFAQSFYNIKDMLFASLTMITLCCAERVLATGRKPVWCALFALSGALLVTARIVGALLIVFVLCAMLLQDLANARREKAGGGVLEKASRVKRLLPYALILCAYPIWLVLTPASWSDPIGFSLGYALKFSNYNGWHGAVAFAGKLVPYNEIPRAYFITWIALTVPIVNQLLCLLGVGLFAARSKKCDLTPASQSILWMALLLLAGTIGYQYLRQPVVYNGWRQAFYLYPLIVVFAVFAVRQVWRFAAARNQKWLSVSLACILACSLSYNAYRIASNHPYEHSLFNAVGRAYANAYERDYWCLTYCDMAKWLLENADSAPITVGYYDGVIDYIIDARVHDALPPEAWERFSFCYKEEAEYLLANFTFRPGPNDFPIEGFREIHAIFVDGVKLAAVYQRVPAA